MIPASAVATSSEGISPAASFVVTVTPSPDVSAAAVNVTGTETAQAQTLALAITTTITDASVGSAETLQRVVIDFTDLPAGASFSAGTLIGNQLVLDVSQFGGDPAALQSALAALAITLPPGLDRKSVV